jgi:hypothetical protein
MTKRTQGLLLSAALSILAVTSALAQTIGSADIIDGSIQAIDIAPETITTGRILNETIQAIDIAPESITTGRILNRTIKAIDIATESIGTAEIKNETIDAIDLAPETITTGRIKNETIQAIDLAPETITTGRILNRTIKAIDIATESITTAEIKNGTIAGVDLANGTVTAAKLGLARTIFIADSGNDTANCTALRDALDGLVGPAAVLLGPGTYDCGASPLSLPAQVELVGAGRLLTNLTSTSTDVFGFLRLADETTVRDLTVSSGESPIARPEGGSSWRLIGVDIVSGGIAGLVVFTGDCGDSELFDVGSSSAHRAFELGCTGGHVVATRLKAVSTGTLPGAAAIVTFGNGAVTVRDSSLSNPSGTSVTKNDAGLVRVISSELDGPVSGTVVCVGGYDETGAALADGTFGSGGCI